MENLVERAMELAQKWHKGQKYGDMSYMCHLYMVGGLVKLADLPVPVLAAAFIHDVLEDTECPVEELQAGLSPEVVRLAVALTRTMGMGLAEYLGQLKEAGHAAIALKLCDRTANALACHWNSNARTTRLLERYKAEYVPMEKALREWGVWDKLWLQLRDALQL
jgi:guanosine-3',5'-bis(diphosphate) 3'-pyrophosphohydrolase